MKYKYRILALIIPLIILSACKKPSNVTLPGNIQSISEEMASNLLKSLDSHNYKTFSRDFNSNMRKAMTEDAFENMYATFNSKAGEFKSFQYEKVETEQGFVVAYFNVIFSKGNFTLRLVLEPEEPYKIAGIWFPDFTVD